MNRPYKHIDLGDKFSDFKHSPNDSVWENISGGLNQNKGCGVLKDKFEDFAHPPSTAAWSFLSAEVHPNRKKKAAGYWWFSGVAAALIGLIFFSGLTHGESQNVAYTPRANDTFAALAQEVSSHDAETIFSNAFDQNKNKVSAFRKLLNTHEEQNTSGKTEVLASQNTFSADVDSTIIFSIEKEMIRSRKGTLLSSVEYDNAPAKHVAVYLPSSQSSKAWDLSLKGALQESTSFASNEIASAYSIETSSQNDFEEITEANSFGDLGFVSPENFKTPISFSINAETPILTRMRRKKKTTSAGFGLGYLEFNSSNTASIAEENTVTTSSISRKYLTLPVFMKHNFIEKKKLDVYAKLGTQGELGVSGSQELETTSDNSLTVNKKSKFQLGSGQVNVNAGIGTQIKVSNNISAFAEANIARYVKLSHYTYWSNQRFWPAANFGITFNIQ